MSFDGVTKDIKDESSPCGKEIRWSKMGGSKYGVKKNPGGVEVALYLLLFHSVRSIYV